VGTHARVTVTSHGLVKKKKKLWLRNLTSIKKKRRPVLSSGGFVRIFFRDVAYNFSLLLGKKAFKSYFFKNI